MKTNMTLWLSTRCLSSFNFLPSMSNPKISESIANLMNNMTDVIQDFVSWFFKEKKVNNYWISSTGDLINVNTYFRKRRI